MESGRPSVLIADSDPELVNHLLDLLERDAYRVLVARDTAEAVELAANHQPDLLLLEVLLPGGGGYAVVDRLRQRLPERQPEVIFLTGLDQPEQIRQGFEAGAVDYITKPFSPAQLRARVRTWLLRRDKQNAPPSDADGEAPHAPPCAEA